MFARLRLSTRLSLLLGFMVVAMLAVAGYGLFVLRQAQASATAAIELSADLVQAIDAARAAEVASKVQVQEFKNVLLRGHEQQDYDRHFAAFRTRSDAIARGFGEAREAMERRGLPTAAIDDAQRLQSGILQAHLEALKSFDASRPDAARTVDALVRGKDQPLGDKIAEIVRAVEDFAQAETARAAEAAAAQARAAVVLYLALVGAAATVALLVGTLVIRGLLRELGGEPAYAKEVAERIADGDLTLQVQVRPGDRGSMLLAMARMAESLRGLVGEVAAGARGVADASAQIAQGNTDLSQRTEEQASTLEETASQMEELTSTVTQNAGNARAARDLALSASGVAGKGGEVVGAVVRTMSGISEASRRIGDIIGVIDGIAFQTNILALNAAVEAARAGEQGRGFAVVAAEVRSLAQRSAAAAREIKTLIGNSVEQVDAGSRLVDAAGKTMQDIVASVKKVSDLIADIAVASEEQSSGIEQVSTAVAQMDRVVQQNAALVEEASAATEAMTAQADALLRKVARFRLASDAEVTNAEHAAPVEPAAANANAFELTYV